MRLLCRSRVDRREQQDQGRYPLISSSRWTTHCFRTFRTRARRVFLVEPVRDSFLRMRNGRACSDRLLETILSAPVLFREFRALFFRMRIVGKSPTLRNHLRSLATMVSSPFNRSSIRSRRALNRVSYANESAN